MVIHGLAKSLPIETSAMTTAVQPFEQLTTDLMQVLPQTPAVATYPEIREAESRASQSTTRR